MQCTCICSGEAVILHTTWFGPENMAGDGKRMKGQTHRNTQRKAGIRWTMWNLMEWHQLHNVLLPQSAYYIQHRERYSLISCRAEQLASHSRKPVGNTTVRICREEAAVARFWTHRSVICKDLYLHTLSVFALRPEEGFANPQSPTPGQGFAILMGLSCWVLDMVPPVSNNTHPLRTSSTPYTLTQGFLNFPHTHTHKRQIENIVIFIMCFFNLFFFIFIMFLW